MKRILVVTMFFLTFSATFAQVKNRFELGVGGFQAQEGVDLLFRLENTMAINEKKNEEDVFLVISVKGELATDLQQLTYLDFGFGLTIAKDLVDNEDGRVYFGYNALNIKVEKNIFVDQQSSYRISFVGAKFGIQQNIPDSKIKYFAQVAADLLTFYDVRRRSDGAALSSSEFGQKLGFGFDAFFGLDINNKVRITLGYEHTEMNAVGVGSTEYSCYDYYDDFGFMYTECNEYDSVTYLERWKSNKFYVEATANLTKSLGVFGRAGYSVFSLADDTNYFPDSKTGAWQFVVGLKYKLVTPKKLK